MPPVFQNTLLQLRLHFHAGLNLVDLAFDLPDRFIRLHTVNRQEAKELATLAIYDIELHYLITILQRRTIFRELPNL